MTTEKPIHSRFTGSRTALLLLLTVVAAGIAAKTTAASHPTARTPNVVMTTVAAPTRTCSYNWPIKPFDRQHPVRSFLNDPRIGSRSSAFHFGIDISAPDGTPVYAVEAGTVWYGSPVSIAVVAFDRSHEFGYWHIVPVVKNHQRVGLHQLLGYIGKGWEHVHFAERRGGEYLNPLRPGGLGPYTDRTAPTVTNITVTDLAVVVEAHDTPWPAVAGAWHNEPVTPARLRWRFTGGRVWHTFVDFRQAMLPASQFDQIYTPETRQNHKGIPGRYCFYLARGPQARALANAAGIQVEATDTAGNRTVVEWIAV